MIKADKSRVKRSDNIARRWDGWDRRRWRWKRAGGEDDGSGRVGSGRLGRERSEGEGERFAAAAATTTRGCGGYKREGGRDPRGGEVVDSRWGVRRVGGWKRRTRVGRGRGVRRLSPRRLSETKRSGEKPSPLLSPPSTPPPPPPPGGHRRRDQWTCAGVPRHHGDLLATSRNKMATLPLSIAERWRQSHVVHLYPVAFNWTSLIGTGRILPVKKMTKRLTKPSLRQGRTFRTYSA